MIEASWLYIFSVIFMSMGVAYVIAGMYIKLIKKNPVNLILWGWTVVLFGESLLIIRNAYPTLPSLQIILMSLVMTFFLYKFIVFIVKVMNDVINK